MKGGAYKPEAVLLELVENPLALSLRYSPPDVQQGHGDSPNADSAVARSTKPGHSVILMLPYEHSWTLMVWPEDADNEYDGD